jgi:hypothetical protein
MATAADIILVHSGNTFPIYINDCIEILKIYGFNIHLIIESKFHKNITANRDIKTIDINDIIDYRYTQYSIKNYDMSFRDSFYKRTSSRFFIIDNYAKKYQIESFFHIENDIALFSNLINIKQYLETSTYDIAIIMDSPVRCVPSLIWYKNSIASTRLGNYIYNHNYVDDMKNLAIFFHQNRNTVINLPITPLEIIDTQHNINFSSIYPEILSIFDGAAIGQYLYGTDQSNSIKSGSGFINETCVVDYSKFDIYNKPEPYIRLNSFEVKINNLHMHCKNLKQLL